MGPEGLDTTARTQKQRHCRKCDKGEEERILNEILTGFITAEVTRERSVSRVYQISPGGRDVAVQRRGS